MTKDLANVFSAMVLLVGPSTAGDRSYSWMLTCTCEHGECLSGVSEKDTVREHGEMWARFWQAASHWTAVRLGGQAGLSDRGSDGHGPECDVDVAAGELAAGRRRCVSWGRETLTAMQAGSTLSSILGRPEKDVSAAAWASECCNPSCQSPVPHVVHWPASHADKTRPDWPRPDHSHF